MWIVFYARGARIGSMELTAENLRAAHASMTLCLIQRDTNGTEHYAVCPR